LKKLSILLTSLVLLLALALPGWGAITPITFGTPGEYYDTNITKSPRNCVRDTNGRIFVVAATEDASTPYVEMWMCSNGGTKFHNVGINQASYRYTGVSCYIDGGSPQIIHVVYYSNSTTVVYQQFNTGTLTWSATNTIATVTAPPGGNGDYQVAIALDASSIPHVLYINGTNSLNQLYYLNDVGGSAPVTDNCATESGGPILINSGGPGLYPSIAIDTTYGHSRYNVPQIAFQGTSSHLEAGLGMAAGVPANNPTSFTLVQPYSSAAYVGDTDATSIAINSSGDTNIGGWYYSSSGHYACNAYILAASAWGTAANWNLEYIIQGNITGSTESSLAIDGTNRWLFSNYASPAYLEYNTSTTYGTWGTPAALTSAATVAFPRARWQYANNPSYATAGMDVIYVSTSHQLWYTNLGWTPSTASTYYIDSNSAGGDGTTTATTGYHAAFVTVPDATAAVTGTQAGVSLLLKRGDSFYSPLCFNASGTDTSSNIFTIGAYGSGANPRIYGAIPILGSVWTQNGTYPNVYQTPFYAAPGTFASAKNLQNNGPPTYPVDNSTINSTNLWGTPGGSTTAGCVWYNSNGDFMWGRSAASGLCSTQATPTYTVTAGANCPTFSANMYPGNVIINSVTYAIASITDSTHLILSTTPGTQTNVPIQFPITTVAQLSAITGGCMWDGTNIYINPVGGINTGTTYWVANSLWGVQTGLGLTTASSYFSINNIDYYYGCTYGFATYVEGGGSVSSYGSINYCSTNYTVGGAFDLHGTSVYCNYCTANYAKMSGFAVWHDPTASPTANGNYFNNCTFGPNAITSGSPEWGLNQPKVIWIADTTSGGTNRTFNNITVNGSCANVIYGGHGDTTTITNLTVNSSAAITQSFVYAASLSNLTLTGLRSATACSYGGTPAVYLSGCSGTITLSDNQIPTTTGCVDGVMLSACPGTNQISYNLITGVATNGIQLSNSPASIYNNTLYGWANAIGYDTNLPADALTVKNNIAYNCTNFLSTPSAVAYLTSDYNCAYGCTNWASVNGTTESFATWKANYSPNDSNSNTNNPNFSIPGTDYHLTGKVPGVGVGLASDIEGRPVPVGPVPDMGAYEYQSPGNFMGF
jgi:hypothetical protein